MRYYATIECVLMSPDFDISESFAIGDSDNGECWGPEFIKDGSEICVKVDDREVLCDENECMEAMRKVAEKTISGRVTFRFVGESDEQWRFVVEPGAFVKIGIENLPEYYYPQDRLGKMLCLEVTKELLDELVAQEVPR